MEQVEVKPPVKKGVMKGKLTQNSPVIVPAKTPQTRKRNSERGMSITDLL